MDKIMTHLQLQEALYLDIITVQEFYQKLKEFGINKTSTEE